MLFLFPRNRARAKAAVAVAVGRVVPPRFNFIPDDEQLIVHYLPAYTAGWSLRWDQVVEAGVYYTEPPSLLGDDREIGYFLSKRRRHGNRVKRTTGGGTWTGRAKKQEIVSTGSEVVGFKAMFLFCMGDDESCSKKPDQRICNWKNQKCWSNLHLSYED